MNIDGILNALEKVKTEFEHQQSMAWQIDDTQQKSKGGYFRVGNIAIKIAEITELS